MKHRRHPNFPDYRFYKDGTVINKLTKKKITRKKSHFKLKNKDGIPVSITLDKILKYLFPELNPEPEPIKLPKEVHKKKRIRRTYSPSFKRKIRKELSNGLTWDDIVKKYDIPMGSIGHILKGKHGSTTYINIGKVIIKL